MNENDADTATAIFMWFIIGMAVAATGIGVLTSAGWALVFVGIVLMLIGFVAMLGFAKSKKKEEKKDGDSRGT